MRRLLGMSGMGAGLALAAAAGCGQPFSPLGAGGAGGSGGSTAGRETASTGPASASAGPGGGAPGCSAGMGLAPSSCGSDHYCDTSTRHCAPCAMLDRMAFGTPVPLGLAEEAGTTQMFPRSDVDTGDLFLVVEQMNPAYRTQIATATQAKGREGWDSPASYQPLTGTNLDSGPLYLHDASVLAGLIDPNVAKVGAPVLLFDSDRIPGERRVFALLAGASLAPAPLALPGGAAHESDIAVAASASPPRFFWLSDAGGQPARLVTALATDAAPTDVPIALEDGCAAPLAAMPWVTLGGAWLFFAATRPDASNGCAAPPADAPTHLYATRLDAKGAQVGRAVPVFGAGDASLDNTPSLWSPSLCALLFARFDPSTGAGALYAAQRD